MKKHSFFLFLLLFFLLTLSGCSNSAEQIMNDTNYNQYIYHHGAYAYTEDAYLFFENNSIFFLDSNLTAPLTKLCVRTDCSHDTSSCSSYINTHSIFSANNQIYYLSQDNYGTYGLYELNLKTQKRQCLRDIPELTGNLGFSHRIYNSWLVLEVTKWLENYPISMIWALDLKSPYSKMQILFGSNDNTEISYTAPEMKGDWLFVTAYRRGEQDGVLMGYNFETKQTYELVNPWTVSNVFSVQNNQLYWYENGVGFFSISLEDYKKTFYRQCKSYEYGVACYDDQYIYLTNTLPPLDQLNIIKPEHRGLYIYDYSGTLIQFIPTYEQAIYPIYCLSSPEYVFFYDYSINNLPKYHIQKKMIFTGNAKLIQSE